MNDTVVIGDQSELKQIYDSVKAKGGTDGQAWWEVIKSAGIDIGMAGLGGMFSGVILGGGNMALSNFTKGRAAVGSVKGAMKAGREIALRNANTER